MKTAGCSLVMALFLVGCASLDKGSDIPKELTEQGHVVADVPRNAQVASFLGDFKVTYPTVLSVLLDPFKSPQIKTVTEEFTVEFDKRDSSRVNLFGQTDTYLARWRGSVNGTPFTLAFVFRSPDYSRNAGKENSSVTRFLEFNAAGDGIDRCSLAATGEDIGPPAVFLTFFPSGDQLSVEKIPGVLPLGGLGVRTEVAGTLTWQDQVFLLGKPDGNQTILKGGFLYSKDSPAKAAENEAALVEVFRSMIRSITG